MEQNTEKIKRSIKLYPIFYAYMFLIMNGILLKNNLNHLGRPDDLYNKLEKVIGV